MEESVERGADDGQRRFVTSRETKLHARPRGRVVQELPAGTRVRTTGDADGRFVPVVVPAQDLRGWVRKGDLEPLPVPDGGSGGGHDGGGAQEHGGGPVDGAPDADIGGKIAAESRKYIGFPYRLGTRGPHSFDCSGLVQWVVKQVTAEAISPDSHAQFNLGQPVSADRLRPGDLLFYDTMNGREVREGNPASHVGIFVAPGRMVNALNEEKGVREDDPFSPTYFAERFIGARRLF
jgi:cell wall-associated NlpC family hydrolase